MAFTGEVVSRGRAHQNVHLLIILAFVVAVFGVSTHFEFVWDDHVLLIGHDVYASFDLGRIFFSLANQVEYLPIRDVSYAVDYALWGENPFGFHLTNLTLYFLNAVFVYLMTLRLTPLLFSAGREMPERKAGGVALLTTLLFAVHPVHSEPLSFISCRNVLLSGLFSFMSCHFFLKHLGWRSLGNQIPTPHTEQNVKRGIDEQQVMSHDQNGQSSLFLEPSKHTKELSAVLQIE